MSFIQRKICRSTPAKLQILCQNRKRNNKIKWITVKKKKKNKRKKNSEKIKKKSDCAHTKSLTTLKPRTQHCTLLTFFDSRDLQQLTTSQTTNIPASNHDRKALKKILQGCTHYITLTTVTPCLLYLSKRCSAAFDKINNLLQMLAR